MKKIASRLAILLSVLLVANRCPAQGFFNQKGAWIKNQLKQIALWELYIKDVEKGYQIAREGLQTIGEIKKGDFDLHVQHFNARRNVNPLIEKYAQAMEIPLLYTQIKKLQPVIKDESLKRTFAHLMQDALYITEQLNILLSAGNYSMTDNERINAISKLYAAIEEDYVFAKNFTTGYKILSLQQLKEQDELRTSRILQGIKSP